MQGIFRKENTDKALKYGIYRHLPTYEKIIRNLVSFYTKIIKEDGLVAEHLVKNVRAYVDDANICKRYMREKEVAE